MVLELNICIFWPLKLQFLKEPFPEIFEVLKLHYVITVRGSLSARVN